MVMFLLEHFIVSLKVLPFLSELVDGCLEVEDLGSILLFSLSKLSRKLNHLYFDQLFNLAAASVSVSVSVSVSIS